jgi:glutamate/aspartate transport system substrate-binding protein
MKNLSCTARLAAAAFVLWSFTAVAQDGSGALGTTLERIKARGVVYVGYREAAVPFSYTLPGQSLPTGYTWEICNGVVKAIEGKLGQGIKLVPLPVTDNARVMMLKTGMIDLDCGGAANTVARQKQVGMSNTVYVSEHRVMVRRGDGIERFEQLAGKRAVVLNGGIGERYVRQAALARNLDIAVIGVSEPEEAMALLGRGEVAAFVADDATLGVQKAGQAAVYTLIEGGLAAEPYALMMPKDDPVMKRLVDETLTGMMQGGELARLYARWFEAPIPPANTSLDLPMSPLLKAAIQSPNDKPVN